jgi:HAD superfamily hydrolase (TIGR01549 family)
MRVQLVTLDFWGTLVVDGPRSDERYQQPRVEALKEILDQAGVARSVADWNAAYEGSRTFLGTVWSRQRDVPVERHVDDILTTLDPDLHRRLEGRVRQALIEAYATAIERVPPAVDPAAVKVLSDLRDRGYSLALISNIMRTPGRVLRRVLSGYGLLPLFSATMFSDEVGMRKPAREIFDVTLHRVGVPAHAAVHVGDDLVLDVMGAQQAGLRAIWVSDQPVGGPGVRPEQTIASLAELPDALSKMERLRPGRKRITPVGSAGTGKVIDAVVVRSGEPSPSREPTPNREQIQRRTAPVTAPGDVTSIRPRREARLEEPSVPPPKARPPRRRHALAVSLILTGVGGLVLLEAGYIVHRHSMQRQLAQPETTVASPAPVASPVPADVPQLTVIPSSEPHAPMATATPSNPLPLENTTAVPSAPPEVSEAVVAPPPQPPIPRATSVPRRPREVAKTTAVRRRPSELSPTTGSSLDHPQAPKTFGSPGQPELPSATVVPPSQPSIGPSVSRSSPQSAGVIESEPRSAQPRADSVEPSRASPGAPADTEALRRFLQSVSPRDLGGKD